MTAVMRLGRYGLALVILAGVVGCASTEESGKPIRASRSEIERLRADRDKAFEEIDGPRTRMGAGTTSAPMRDRDEIVVTAPPIPEDLPPPRKAGEKDGPREVHLIVLDNGRSKMLADPQLRQTLQCIRCGACMNHCPVYTRIGGHAYGYVYPGPIGSILTPQLEGLDRAGVLATASSLCHACDEVCPVKIPITEIMGHLGGLWTLLGLSFK